MKKLTRHNALKPLNIEGKKGPLSVSKKRKYLINVDWKLTKCKW
jgi:hypothetical protein